MDRFYINAKAINTKGSRDMQQDACMTSDKSLYSTKGFMAVLSDGIGGMQGGDEYSKLATHGMVDAFHASPAGLDMCTELLNAYSKARRKALEWQQMTGVVGGATVLSVLIRQKYCAFLSVGDSKLYLLRNGGLIRLNRDQKLGVNLDEMAALGYVPDMEAKLNVYRESLTNNFGEKEIRPLDRCLTPFRIAAGDKLVLMSDGVSEAIDEWRLTAYLNKPGTTGAAQIIKEIQQLKNPKQDNSTIMVIHFSTEKPQPKQGGAARNGKR